MESSQAAFLASLGQFWRGHPFLGMQFGVVSKSWCSQKVFKTNRTTNPKGMAKMIPRAHPLAQIDEFYRSQFETKTSCGVGPACAMLCPETRAGYLHSPKVSQHTAGGECLNRGTEEKQIEEAKGKKGVVLFSKRSKSSSWESGCSDFTGLRPLELKLRPPALSLFAMSKPRGGGGGEGRSKLTHGRKKNPPFCQALDPQNLTRQNWEKASRSLKWTGTPRCSVFFSPSWHPQKRVPSVQRRSHDFVASAFGIAFCHICVSLRSRARGFEF